jgi:hypothetical protein
MTLGDFHVNDALAKVAELGSEPGYFAPVPWAHPARL